MKTLQLIFLSGLMLSGTTPTANSIACDNKESAAHCKLQQKIRKADSQAHIIAVNDAVIARQEKRADSFNSHQPPNISQLWTITPTTAR